MARIGSFYVGTKYVTLHLVFSNGDREDLEISVSEFNNIQNKFNAVQQGVHMDDAQVCGLDGGEHDWKGNTCMKCRGHRQ